MKEPINTSCKVPIVDFISPTMARQVEQNSFLQQYNLHLNLRSSDGTIYSEWEGVTNLLLQLQMLDDTIEVWPWVVQDQDNNLPIAITKISHAFFDLQTYVPGLASKTVSLRSRLELGDRRHPSLFLRSSVLPTQLVDKLEPWLRSTGQGMRVRQLPLVEQTICIGWLLYSAPEYDLDELHRQIRQDTGIAVELRFRSIVDEGTGWADGTLHPTKAIHLEIDQGTLPLQLKRIERVYSAEATIFPLGIKMRLVPTGSTGTPTDRDTRTRLINRQARFLKYTETRWIRGEEGLALTPQQCPLYNSLRALTVPQSLANHGCKPLFHAISPSTTNDGYLVCFLPQYKALAQAAIARLLISPTTTPACSDSLPSTKESHISVTSTSSSKPGDMEVLDQWMQLRFTSPAFPSTHSTPHLTRGRAHPNMFRPPPSSSHHKLVPWLTALRKKLQNTAWDWWRYRNGVVKAWQVTTLPAWQQVFP